MAERVANDYDFIKSRIEELKKEREELEKSNIGNCSVCQQNKTPCTGGCYACCVGDGVSLYFTAHPAGMFD